MAFTTEDVVYHSPAGIALTATLYKPAGDGPFAAVVDAHGGRWCSETRMTNRPIDEVLAAAGIFVMALDFRMPPDAQYPLPVADINFAIRWLHAHAGDYGIKPDWIGGVGTSSGGHQLALNALNPDDPKYRQGHTPEMDGASAKINYMIICWPVSDPPARYRYAIANKMDIHIQSHERYWPSEALMAEGSPQRIVADGEAAVLPPALLIQGTNDTILSPGMSERFAETYAVAGGDMTLIHYPDEKHTFITNTPDTDASRKALADMVAFIRRQTRKA
jgi:acetyl esterase